MAAPKKKPAPKAAPSSTAVAAPSAVTAPLAATEKPASPATAPSAKRAKTTAKPIAKTALKPAAKPARKPAEKSGPKAATPKTTPVKTDKPAKEKKPKLVRDSFTIPKAEYLVLEALKQRAAQMAKPVKKSELLRAGIKALAAMTDAALATAIGNVPAIKTGRPSKD